MLNSLAKRKQEHDIQLCVKKIHDGAQRFRANLDKTDAAQVGRLQQHLTSAKSHDAHLGVPPCYPVCISLLQQAGCAGAPAMHQELQEKWVLLREGARHPHNALPLTAQAGCACRQAHLGRPAMSTPRTSPV